MSKRLTEIELKGLQPSDAGRTLRDGNSVLGLVCAGKDRSVSVQFSLRYKVEGKGREARLGTWPAVRLASIRAERDKVRALLRERADPLERRKAARLKDKVDILEAERSLAEEAARREAERTDNLPFRVLFEKWVADGHKRKDGGAELRRSFGKDVLPVLGDKPIRQITDDDIRAVLRAVGQARGRGRMASLLLRDLRQLFAWASKLQPWRRLLAEGDPTASIIVETVVNGDYDLSNMRQRTLEASEIQELRTVFEKMQADYEAAVDRRKAARPVSQETQAALWLCLSTCCRIGELVASEWKHVDLERREWIIPRGNYKRTRGDRRPDYLVCLSDFAVGQFRALKEITGTSDYCFPASGRARASGKVKGGSLDEKTISKQVGDRQIRFKDRKPLKNRRSDDTLVLGAGKKGEWTPHDLRRTGSTLMQELGVTAPIRNLCLNHVIGSKIDQTYGTYDFAAEKREAWRLLGARLDSILTGSNVVAFARGTAAA